MPARVAASRIGALEPKQPEGADSWRLTLNDGDRRTLAHIGTQLGRKALAKVATIVRPDPIVARHRRLVARKFDGSKKRAILVGRRSSERWRTSSSGWPPRTGTGTMTASSMTDVRFLVDHRYLIHDRHGKYCPALRHDQGRWRHAGAATAPQPELERARGAVGTVGEGRVPVEADPLR